tara:strand:- start:704 stop:1090 length:387 start_codon:yes stop_codon:yes gene_type:complete
MSEFNWLWLVLPFYAPLILLAWWGLGVLISIIDALWRVHGPRPIPQFDDDPLDEFFTKWWPPRDAEYWIKVINEAEEHEEVFRLFFEAQKEAGYESAGEKLAIEIHKATKPRMMEAIKSINEKRNNGV